MNSILNLSISGTAMQVLHLKSKTLKVHSENVFHVIYHIMHYYRWDKNSFRFFHITVRQYLTCSNIFRLRISTKILLHNNMIQHRSLIILLLLLLLKYNRVSFCIATIPRSLRIIFPYQLSSNNKRRLLGRVYSMGWSTEFKTNVTVAFENTTLSV